MAMWPAGIGGLGIGVARKLKANQQPAWRHRSEANQWRMLINISGLRKLSKPKCRRMCVMAPQYSSGLANVASNVAGYGVAVSCQPASYCLS